MWESMVWEALFQAWFGTFVQAPGFYYIGKTSMASPLAPPNSLCIPGNMGFGLSDAQTIVKLTPSKIYPA
jgi:hypothetical protein